MHFFSNLITNLWSTLDTWLSLGLSPDQLSIVHDLTILAIGILFFLDLLNLATYGIPYIIFQVLLYGVAWPIKLTIKLLEYSGFWLKTFFRQPSFNLWSITKTSGQEFSLCRRERYLRYQKKLFIDLFMQYLYEDYHITQTTFATCQLTSAAEVEKFLKSLSMAEMINIFSPQQPDLINQFIEYTKNRSLYNERHQGKGILLISEFESLDEVTPALKLAIDNFLFQEYIRTKKLAVS